MIKSRQKLEWIQPLKERNHTAIRSTFIQVFQCVPWQFMQHTGDRSQGESRSHPVQKNQRSEFRSTRVAVNLGQNPRMKKAQKESPNVSINPSSKLWLTSFLQGKTRRSIKGKESWNTERTQQRFQQLLKSAKTVFSSSPVPSQKNLVKTLLFLLKSQKGHVLGVKAASQDLEEYHKTKGKTETEIEII